MKKLVEALKSFGLSEYEAKVLLALIAKGELTAKEISEFSGVPRTSVYDVIKSLMDKGLVESYGKPMKFRALDSSDLMRIFSKKVEENLRFLREELPAVERGETEEVRVYRGELAFDKITELTRSAKKVEIVASFIPDEILDVLRNSKCELIACALNVDEVKGLASKAYRLRFAITDSKLGLIILDDETVAVFFKNKVPLAIVGSGKGFVSFYKMLVGSILSSNVVESVE